MRSPGWSPTVRLGLAIALAVLLGGALASLYGPLITVVRQLRGLCLADVSGNPFPCTTFVRYPNRLPAVLLALLILAAAALMMLLARWCLRPFEALVDVVARMGPTNLGYRLGFGPGRDVFRRLGRALDTMMDSIAGGYASQSRFAATASHELRTPLAVQRTLIEVSMHEALTPDQLSLLTSQLLEANQRNERLIEGLLVLAEAEQAPVGHLPQRLDRIAAKVVDRYAERAQTAGVTLSLHAKPSTVAGEEVLLERLVTNLVQNAISYNVADEGTVRVDVEPTALTVTNTGPVVAAEDVDALFEAFRRGSGERLGSGGGAGLGLTITRAVAHAHGATIGAHPGPAGGLTVRVDFPRVDLPRVDLPRADLPRAD